MKHEANWLVLFLDDKKDFARQNIKGLEVDEVKNDDQLNSLHPVRHDHKKAGLCASMVIYPLRSSWHSIWKIILKLVFFWGYYNNFLHIGFVLGQAQYELDHAKPGDEITL